MECQTNIVRFLAPNPTWRLHHSARVRTRSLQTKPVSWARCERKLLARSFKIPYFRVPPEDPPYPRRGTPGRFYFKVLLVTHSSPPTTASSRWWLWQEPVTKVSYLYSKVSYSCRLHSPTSQRKQPGLGCMGSRVRTYSPLPSSLCLRPAHPYFG